MNGSENVSNVLLKSYTSNCSQVVIVYNSITFSYTGNITPSIRILQAEDRLTLNYFNAQKFPLDLFIVITFGSKAC